MAGNDLSSLFIERIASSLRRKSVVSPSIWARNYRVMGKPFPGPWTFRRHPWLEAMHDSDAALNVGQKSAQMGFTETVLNVVLYQIDMREVDCLYVLPSKTPDASDFSAARFDAALDLSSHLQKLFSDVKNVGHKRAGTVNLYIRGAKSRSGLKSIPVGVIILDEKDEMNQDNIPLARERQSGYDDNLTWEISTPTIPDWGINETFNLSSKQSFFFKCRACSRRVDLTWPDAIEICGEDYDDPRINESFIKCPSCAAEIPHAEKHEWLSTGTWIPENAEREVAGWYVNQLYSSTVHPSKIVESYFKSKQNPADEQEFYNSKLGQPHIVEGAKLTEQHIDNCLGGYLTHDQNQGGLVTIGIDVGNYLHFEIDKWKLGTNVVDISAQAECQVLAVGKVQEFEQLYDLMDKYQVTGGVIDIQPERRKAYEFATKYWGRIRLCYYGRGIHGKQIHVNNDDELTLTVDRTSWLDLALGRFRTKRITLPRDIPREYRRHMTSLVRIYEKDVDGNPVGKYVKASSSEDHFAHARNYNEIALPLVAALGKAHNMSGRL